MASLPKPYFARLSFGIGVIGLIMGSILACYCWGWFVCTGAFFIYPVLKGDKWVRNLSCCLIAVSLCAAVWQFRAEAKVEQRASQIRVNGDRMPGMVDIPQDSKVVLNLDDGEFKTELPENLRALFVSMLRSDARYIDASMLPAAPKGEFLVAGRVFEWHGNAVIEGTHLKGRVWVSPVTQALINRTYLLYPNEREKWSKALGELNDAADIQSTLVGGVGEYPYNRSRQ